jgi:UDP-N-acetylmuramate dehydrogenase
MSEIKENFSLLGYNTFQVAANTRFFVELADMAAVKDLLALDLPRAHPHFVLGHGSNVLFTKDFEGVVIRPSIKGIEKTGENNDTVLIRAGAGEEWDSFVEHCVDHEWGGIENLSLIPGTVGACPVQNIGAYGVEIMDFIDSVEGFRIKNAKSFRLSAKECCFSYRDSIFKKVLKDEIIITHVNFRLQKKHQIKTAYPDLEKELDNYPNTTINTIRQAVMAIRRNKLPDPAVTGNAGSFFKNPCVTKEHVDSLRRYFPGIPGYNCADGSVKLSAAWLIEQCGWKGKSCGKTGIHKKQPLIIVNRGGASGEEIYQCALKVQKSVMNHFAIRLEMEVNIL